MLSKELITFADSIKLIGTRDDGVKAFQVGTDKKQNLGVVILSKEDVTKIPSNAEFFSIDQLYRFSQDSWQWEDEK